MLKTDLALKILEKACCYGADFADIFVEQTRSRNFSINSSEVKSVTQGIDFGIGVRLIYGTQVLYSYTNSLEEKDLLNLVEVLAQNVEKKAAHTQVKSLQHQSYRELQSYQDSQGLEDYIGQMMKWDELIRDHSQMVSQVDLSCLWKNQKVEIFNSDGLHISEERPYARLAARVIVGEDGQLSDAYWAPGALGDLSFIQDFDLKKEGEDLVQSAMTLLKAAPSPAGKLPVVIGNGFGGVIFHEACGHILETTSVEKKASVFWDHKGELIANPVVNAIDDGQMDNYWGSLAIDDEGMPTQKTQLIKDGVLENFLCDYVGHLKTGHPRTGSGRKQSYKFAPASRMRNTYIDAGKDNFEEMIASMDKGIYAKKMGGGSVNPGTGEFNFSVQEGYLVENGKITTPIKGATLIGKGEDILKQISMVSSDLELAAGMCGSVSGNIPTTVGQPAIKVDDILVGGQS